MISFTLSAYFAKNCGCEPRIKNSSLLVPTWLRIPISRYMTSLLQDPRLYPIGHIPVNTMPKKKYFICTSRISFLLFCFLTEKPKLEATGNIQENKPFNLSCTVRFKSIPNWVPEVNISDGTKNLQTNRILNDSRILVEAQISTPTDGQSYNCSASFANPPANAIDGDSLTFNHDRKAPLFKQEQDLIPYNKPSKYINDT